MEKFLVSVYQDSAKNHYVERAIYFFGEETKEAAAEKAVNEFSKDFLEEDGDVIVEFVIPIPNEGLLARFSSDE